MRKIFLLIFLIPSFCWSYPSGTTTIFNYCTGCPDFIGGTAPPSFSCALSDGLAASLEIGSGVFKNAGDITFNASYANGTPLTGDVSFSGWSSTLSMTNMFQGPTISTDSVNYPSVGGTVVFSLSATSSSGSAGSTLTHTFTNDRYYGITTVASGYTLTDMQAFGTTDLINQVGLTFSSTAGVGQYLAYAYPSRLGTASFTVNNFSGGFVGPETDSITNASGYTENYYVYRSFNTNLDAVTVVVTTP